MGDGMARRERPAGAVRLSRRAALVGGGLGLAAALPAAARVRAQEATPVAGEGGGIDRAAVEAALPQIVAMAEEAVASGGVPGLSLAVVFQDEVLLAQGFGVRSTADGGDVDADTVFQLASLSKPVGSTVISAIVGSGAATWDDRVSAHLPGFELSDPWATQELTIGDFYAHRSGLGGDAGGDLERVGYGREEILERLRYLDLASSPRSTYAYSNKGMTTGAMAAAAAAGMSWEDASEALLYAPLGMTNTSSRYADYEAAENRAALHVRIDGAWEPRFPFDPDAQSPAGGVSSSANDLAQWLRLLLADGTFDGADLIPAAALDEAHTPRMSRGTNPMTGGPSFYGYGWGIDYPDGRTQLSHAGAFTYGARTLASLSPSEDLGIVVLTNAFPTGAPDGLAAAFFDIVRTGSPSRDWIAAWNPLYESILGGFAAGGAAYEDLPASPSPALPAEAYAGVYENAYAGSVEVAVEGDGLVLKLGPEPRSFPLTHFERDVFTYEVDLEPPAPLTGATFVIGPDGKANAVQLDYFAGNGQGTFPRREDG